MNGDLLVGPGLVATPDQVHENAGVLIQQGRITEIGDYQPLTTSHPTVSKLDTVGQLIMPGLINAHMHFYSTLARGMALKDDAPENFVQTLERLWWRLDKALDHEDIGVSALVPLIACIKSGVTTIVDHHASPTTCEGSLDVIRGAVEQAGVRAALCYEVSDRDGEERANAGIEENIRFARSLEQGNHEQFAALFGLHALFTLSEETLARCASEAKDLDIGLHVHLAEDIADVEYNLDQYGEHPLARLQRHGGLNEKALLGHCVHVGSAEIDMLKQYQPFVAHNPESNMNNAVGCAPVVDMIDAGVRLGLGTDGMSADMLATARSAFLLMRHQNSNPRLGWEQIPQMLWGSNSELASGLFGLKLGVLEPGAAGDLMVLDYDPATPLQDTNLLGHLLFGFSSRHVVSTVAGGKVLMKDRELTGMDEKEIYAHARERAVALWERF